MAKTLLPIDEINTLKASIEKNKPSVNDIIDEMLDLFLLAYALGVQEANGMLGTELTGWDWAAKDAVYRKVDGKDFTERVKEYADVGDYASIGRVMDTEAHRIFNEGAFDIAGSAGATTKEWRTMQDDKVRDTHSYLDGVKMPLYADFITYDGDHARYPGDFSSAANNCNCRCYLVYSK